MQVDGAASSQCKKVFTRKLAHDVGWETSISIFLSQNINTKGENSTILNNALFEFQLQGTCE